MNAKAAPRPTYDPKLPITACREEFLAALRDHQVLIVAGETGSGKTTQIPKLCLDAGRGLERVIGCTQPRRIAAQAMAARVAEELGVEVGQQVGYQVRFRDRTSEAGLIKFMTDGILLAETVADPRLLGYDTLIIDEAHERSLNIDFLLGYLKTLLPRRPDLKLIVTSATIDTEKFARHFENAPIIEVTGRGYPVEVAYRPLDDTERDPETSGRDLYRAIAEAVKWLSRTDPRGDILVFLSGEREIREAGDFLARQRFAHTEILPLYARLSTAEQRRVFHSGPQRRIILSTNVAETSLTVPRIRFVIDSGLARISRYSHRSRIQRLPIEPVSQASANQRAGRCGRLGPGICVRLYSEADFQGRPPFTEPEILRTALGSVVLRLAVMGLGEIGTFPFIDPPAPRMINEAYDLLIELGAMTRKRRPTALGRQLDRWPLDVRLGRMVIEGDRLGCLEDVLVLAAVLSIQDPRERPLDAQQAADDSHRRFVDEKSDFAGLLKLWDYLRARRREVSGNRFRALCRREFFSWQRVLEWFDLYQQLRDQARENRMRLSGKRGGYDNVHQALLTGLLSHIGLKHPEDRSYQGARGRSFHVFPGSGLFGRSPRWIMSAEIVETTRPWGRVNAEIQPAWIERQGAHLLKRHYHDPHWSRKRGAVLAWEQVTLYGLVVVEKRRVDYARIDRAEARRIFILEALVRGELDTRSGFMAHNRELREEIEALEHKRRRHDVLADEMAQYDFFDARVPEHVVSARSLEKWLKGLGDEERQSLYLGYDVLMREDAGAAPEDQFPDALSAGGRDLPLEYHFEPGHEADGVTVRVPLKWLNTLDPGQIQWLVPGLLRDKLIALIRSLRKSLRRALTPVPNFADALLQALRDHRDIPLLDACARELTRMTGLDIRPGDFNEQALPDHLLMRVVVLGDDGREQAASRSLVDLHERFGAEARKRFMRSEGSEQNIDGVRDWVFGTMDHRVETPSGLDAWPALVDQGDAVGLRLFDTAEEAAVAHGQGVHRLLALGLTEKFAYLRRHTGLSRESQLAWAAWGSVAELAEDLVRASLEQAAGDVWTIRDEAAFVARLEEARARIGLACRRQSDLLNEILPVCARIERALQGAVSERWPEAAGEIGQQLDDLVYPGFLADLAPGRLAQYPRYLAAMEERLRQLEEDPKRDRRRAAEIAPFWRRYVERLDAGKPYDQALDAYRWQIEELRVSVFAQQLGTAEKVSPKRLEAGWRRVLAAENGG